MKKSCIVAALAGFFVGVACGLAGRYRGFDAYLGFDPHAEGITSANDASESPHGTAEHEHHEGHEEHEENKVKLSAEAIHEFGLETALASGGTLQQTLKLPGEIVLNADTVAHIVPRVTGMVREVFKNAGDKVEAGEVMAVLESRELAEARAADLAAESRLALAQSNFDRIEKLAKSKIVSEQEYYQGRQKLEEAKIEHREAEAKLAAVGISHDQLASVPDDKSDHFSQYQIKAPFSGTVVEKHITRGEVHDSKSDVFLLADLSTVWVEITVYAQDAARVHAGTKVRLRTTEADGQAMYAESSIVYVSPIVRESTRTGVARAVLANDKHLWKPGLFVTVEVVLSQEEVAVLVPNSAIQTIDNLPVIFVAEGDEFEKRVVFLGHSNDLWSQVTAGLKPGEPYVAKGAFILKAELNKGTGEHEH